MNNYEMMKYYEQVVDDTKQVIAKYEIFLVNLNSYKNELEELKEMLLESEENFFRGGYISNGKTIDEDLLHSKQIILNDDMIIVKSVIKKMKIEIEQMKNSFIKNQSLYESYSEKYKLELNSKFKI